MSDSKLVSIKRILFATDFSPFSERARDFALTLALSLKSEIVVAHAIAELGLAIGDEDPSIRQWCEQLEQKVRLKLEETVGYFQDRQLSARGELRWGAAWRMILTLCEEETVDLVVVGSHGLTGDPDQFRLGTTSHRVALACSVPVLIVRPDGKLT